MYAKFLREASTFSQSQFPPHKGVLDFIFAQAPTSPRLRCLHHHVPQTSSWQKCRGIVIMILLFPFALQHFVVSENLNFKLYQLSFLFCLSTYILLSRLLIVTMVLPKDRLPRTPPPRLLIFAIFLLQFQEKSDFCLQ